MDPSAPALLHPRKLVTCVVIDMVETRRMHKVCCLEAAVIRTTEKHCSEMRGINVVKWGLRPDHRSKWSMTIREKIKKRQDGVGSGPGGSGQRPNSECEVHDQEEVVKDQITNARLCSSMDVLSNTFK